MTDPSLLSSSSQSPNHTELPRHRLVTIALQSKTEFASPSASCLLSGVTQSAAACLLQHSETVLAAEEAYYGTRSTSTLARQSFIAFPLAPTMGPNGRQEVSPLSAKPPEGHVEA